jgi:hypothetical protein
MSFDLYIKESYADVKINSPWSAQVHDSFDFFVNENDEDHSDLSFIYKMDNFSIIHHYDDSPALLLSDFQKEKVGLKQALSCEINQVQNKKNHENSINKSNNINPFCHDKMEKYSYGIHKSTQIQVTSKESSRLSDASNGDPSQNSSKHLKESAKRKVGRKPENLGLVLRKDVVLKTLLRKIRTWFQKDFSLFTGFKTMNDNENAGIYSECLKKYSSEKIFSSQSETFLFYLSGLMSSKNTEQQVFSEHGLFYESDEKKKLIKFSRVREIHGLLYKFSNTKLKK